MPTLDDIAQGLSCGKPGCHCGRVHGGNVATHCPAHDDGHTSLSVTDKGGKLLLHCHAGCAQGAVIDALKARGLWHETERREAAQKPSPMTSQIVATYDYQTENGELLYQVCRMRPKKFRQRRPDGHGGYVWSLGEVRRVLFHLPGVLNSTGPVFVVEGEKDALALMDEGLTATTNAGGAGKWLPEYSESLRGRYVVILPDNDPPGAEHAQKVAAALQGFAKSVRIVNLPDLPAKGDVSDWLARGGDAVQLMALAKQTPVWEPPKEAPGAFVLNFNSASLELELATAWADEFRDEFLYVEGDQWWRYEAGRWHYSSLEIVQAAVQGFLTRLAESNPKLAVTRARIQNVVFLGKSRLGPVPLSEFDAHPEWIPLRNGVFDTRTGELLPHCPDYRLTHQADYDFDPDAKCPRWQKFLQEVMLTSDRLPHSEWIAILQEWFGYCLIADTRAQAAMFWVGEGQNGKGTATRVLEQLIGPEYCTAIPIEQLHDPYYRASLYGKLVGLVNEPDPKALQKNGNYFKALTGDDKMDARRPTEKVFSFKPTCRLVISCNDLPSTRDVSRGYFRRIILIEWRFNIPDGQGDTGLDETLVGELPGIFNWAVKGLMRWGVRGRKFDVPQESAGLLADYRMSEDTLSLFLCDETEKDEHAFVSNTDLYAAYGRWCKAAGEERATSAAVGRRLKKQGYVGAVRKIGGRSVRGWQGLIMTGADD